MCGCISFHVVICECICLCQSCLMPADLVYLLVCEYYLLFVNFLCLLSSLLLCLCHSLWVLFILFTNCWSLSLALSLLARMWVLPLIFPTHCLLTTFLLCLCSPGSECHLLFVLFAACWHLTLSLLIGCECHLLFIYCLLTYPPPVASLWVPPLIHLILCLIFLIARLWVPVVCCIHCLMTSLLLYLSPSACEYGPCFALFVFLPPNLSHVSAPKGVSSAPLFIPLSVS